MTSREMQRRWGDAIDAAAAALAAGREAHELPVALTTTMAHRLEEERRWLRGIRWSDLLL